SGTRCARALGTDGEPPRASSDGQFYRRVIGEESTVQPSTLVGPAHRGCRRQAAHEDLVDAVGDRLREAVEPRTANVRVAGEHDALGEVDEPADRFPLPLVRV